MDMFQVTSLKDTTILSENEEDDVEAFFRNKGKCHCLQMINRFIFSFVFLSLGISRWVGTIAFIMATT